MGSEKIYSNNGNGQSLNESNQIMEQKYGAGSVMSMYQYPPDMFQAIMQNQLRQLALTDLNVQRGIIQHQMALERAQKKSDLRMQEYHQKQVKKQICEMIVGDERAYYYECYDGYGDLLGRYMIFSAKIQSVQSFRYHGTDKLLWQVIVVISGEKFICPPYSEDDLKTISKLKKTILSTLVCSDNAKRVACFWKWLQSELIRAVYAAEAIEIPVRPGWYESDEHYHFYSMSDEDTSRFMPNMRGFRMRRFEAIGVGDTLGILLNELEQTADLETSGMLVMHRFGTLFGRLAGYHFDTGIIIWGEKAENVACSYLRTMDNKVDKVNLDSDRKGNIMKRVCSLQDTPVIFLIANLENKSVKNRLQDALSWMSASCIEGESVKSFFVFCLKDFSTRMPLENMIVLDASKIRLLQDEEILDKFQCLVVENIERAGNCWAAEIANRYAHHKKNGMSEILSMCRTIKEVLLNMFSVIDVSGELHYRLQALLEAGEEAIEAQLSTRQGRAIEIFKDCVIDLADKDLIMIYDREEVPVKGDEGVIYYDKECYYFTTKALQKVCKLSDIDQKSALHIKQELSSMSMLKQYKFTGSRQAEMNVDFRIYYTYGQHKDLSGMAVFREFWDEIGGIALCERN